MSGSQKTSPASSTQEVSSLVESLREADPPEAKDAASSDAQGGEDGAGQELEAVAKDPREEAKILRKAPCDRLDDLSDVEPTTDEELVRIVEGLVFAAPSALHVRDAVTILEEDYDEDMVRGAFKVLADGRAHSGLQLCRTAKGFRWATDPKHAKYMQRLVIERPQRLTRPQLETLAVIAYRQPVTRPEIDHVRGVDSSATLKALQERELICVVGQTGDPGRPRLYGTTLHFLEFLNITELDSLPPMVELRQISDRTRDFLRSKVGAEEAERLSAQVLEMAQLQDEDSGPLDLSGAPSTGSDEDASPGASEESGESGEADDEESRASGEADEGEAKVSGEADEGEGAASGDEDEKAIEVAGGSVEDDAEGEEDAEGESGEGAAEGESGEEDAEGESGEGAAEGESGEEDAEGESGEEDAEGESGEEDAEVESGEGDAAGESGEGDEKDGSVESDEADDDDAGDSGEEDEAAGRASGDTDEAVADQSADADEAEGAASGDADEDDAQDSGEDDESWEGDDGEDDEEAPPTKSASKTPKASKSPKPASGRRAPERLAPRKPKAARRKRR